MALPAKYQWLEGVEGLPKVVTEGLALIGISEIIGPNHNTVIMGWARALGLEKIYTKDELAWCGLFHAWVLTRASKHIPLKGFDLLRALKYQAFGVPVNQAMLGDTLIFRREGGGHVGTYIAESDTTYHVLGGNQGNTVSIIEIEKKRLVAARRPVYQTQPAGVKKFFLSSTGNVSTNEA